jgi:hypothetical protein
MDCIGSFERSWLEWSRDNITGWRSNTYHFQNAETSEYGYYAVLNYEAPEYSFIGKWDD